MFQRNDNRFISLLLKAKQQKEIQLPYDFFVFVMNQFLLFLHLPDLWNLFIYVENIFQCYSLSGMKVILIYYLHLINPYKLMSGYLYFHFGTNYRKHVSRLLEISDRFSSKLNVFSYMIFQCWLNILESFITMLYDFEKLWLGSFVWASIACTTNFHFFNKEEGWNFLNWKKCNGKDFNLAYGGWNA